MNLGAFQQAISTIEQKRNDNINNYNYNYAKYAEAYNHGDYISASSYLEQCIKLKVEQITYYFIASYDELADLRIQKADCYEKRGFLKSAIEQYNILLDLYSNNSIPQEYADFARKKIKELTTEK